MTLKFEFYRLGIIFLMNLNLIYYTESPIPVLFFRAAMHTCNTHAMQMHSIWVFGQWHMGLGPKNGLGLCSCD
jgi:hypothetical protein